MTTEPFHERLAAFAEEHNLVLPFDTKARTRGRWQLAIWSDRDSMTQMLRWCDLASPRQIRYDAWESDFEPGFVYHVEASCTILGELCSVNVAVPIVISTGPTGEVTRKALDSIAKAESVPIESVVISGGDK